MPLFSKNAEQAQAAITKAQNVVSEWEAKAAAARAEVARLNAESGAAILADESAADRIALNVQSWELKAKAYSQAATEARQKLSKAQQEALETEAKDEDKEAASLHKQAESHHVKVEALRKQLEELDDCSWMREPYRDSVTGNVSAEPTGKGGFLEAESERHAVRAAVIRYFIATGTTPADYYDVNNVVGTSFNGFARSIHEIDSIPSSVKAARDAGLNFAGATK